MIHLSQIWLFIYKLFALSKFEKQRLYTGKQYSFLKAMQEKLQTGCRPSFERRGVARALKAPTEDGTRAKEEMMAVDVSFFSIDACL
jgi:hypothetical protein